MSKYFLFPEKVEVLKNIHLILQKGETLAITGRSGEGKSTLLHILGLLQRPSSGDLLLFGKSHPISQQAKVRSIHLGFIFQSFYLLEDLSALENVLMPARIAHKDLSVARMRAMMLLERVGLLSRSAFPAKLLSGGEKQRVAIARALCNAPSLILADEPTGNLDSMHARMILDLLLDLSKREKTSLIVATHDPTFTSSFDRTLLLSEGILT